MKKYLNLSLVIFTLLLFNSLLNAQITTIRTDVHIIRYSDGSGMTEQTARDAIDILNNYYMNTNMKFIIDEIFTVNTGSTTFNFDFIDCTAISPINLPDPIIQDALNIYFFPNLMNGNQGVTFQVPGNSCAVSYNSAQTSTLAHEVGHCFGLFHTDAICNGYENIVRTFDPETNCYPNWDVAGDKIGDTPAQRNPDGYSYDNCNIDYPTTNPNFGNIMDTQTGAGARTFFTYGQKQRMQDNLQNVLNNIKFKVYVIASNKISGENQSGTTLHFDGRPVNSGEPIDLFYGINHISKTDDEILNTTFKHHDWDNDFTQYKLTENYNIDKNNLKRDAIFINIYPISIKNRLKEVSNSDLGDKEIKDPWWVDGSGNQPNIYRELSSSTAMVFLEQDPTFDPNIPNYSVKAVSPQDINLGGSLGTHRFYFLNRDGTDVTFDNANADETAVVFQDSIQGVDPVAQANFKGTQLSNDVDAFNTNSQRKFVKSDDGYLHKVYQSLGHVWYEISPDNGQTWEIMNDGKPLDNGEGKLPAIDFATLTINGYQQYYTIIVYQEKYNDNYKIVAQLFKNDDGIVGSNIYIHEDTDLLSSSQPSYSNNANPVVAFKENGDFMTVWEFKGAGAGLFVRRATVNSSGILLFGNFAQKLNGTDVNSFNPTIVAPKAPQYGNYRLAYQQGETQLKYGTVNNSLVFSNLDSPSDNGIFTKNRYPSISLYNNVDPIISWTGSYKNVGSTSKQDASLWVDQVVSRAYGRDASGNAGWGSFFIAGSEVNYSNNNSTFDNNAVIVWSQSDPPVTKWAKRRSNGIYADMGDLSNSGVQTQVSSGINLTSIEASVFNKQSVPYNFTLATTDFSVEHSGGGGVSKITNEAIVYYGRAGIITKGAIGFIFNIGDITVGDSVISFIPQTDTIPYRSEDELNQLVRTVNFQLNQQTEFYFSNKYFVINSEFADSLLTDEDVVNFKAELINSSTGEIAGTYDNITYNLSNLEKYDNIDYQVDCSGIEPGEYYLRLTTTVQGDAAYSLANIQEDNVDLNKKNYKKVLFNGESLPKTYELSQNYPNPFNPSTTIRYQLPQDGLVTLKIYDILGREVKTLVNEEKAKGRYEVNFNASNLASGVYLYRIRVNDYVAVKKMMLIK